MAVAFNEAYQVAEKYNVDTRTAGYTRATDRFACDPRMCGIYSRQMK